MSINPRVVPHSLIISFHNSNCFIVIVADNQYFQACRPAEKKLNSCVFQKLNLKKNIPGSPEGQPQVFEKKNPIFTQVQK